MDQIVRCITQSTAISGAKGDIVSFPIGLARVMHAMGQIKIIDDMAPKKVKEDTSYIFRTHFSGRTKTRVAWVQNYSKNGGAELSNFFAVSVGEKLGFDIVGAVLDHPSFSYKILESAEIIIVNNLHCDKHDEFIEWLLASKKQYIVYSHDCFEKDLRLFASSLLNVFISPLHGAHYEALCGDSIKGRSLTLPLAIDTAPWGAEGDRIKDSVFVPTYRKGEDAIADYITAHLELTFYVAGDIQPIGKNVIGLGEIDYLKMPEEYRKYETVIHLPSVFGAGERVVFEAILSGCKIETNANAGHASWDFDWRNPVVLKKALDEAVYSFWAAVDRAYLPVQTPKKTISIVTRMMNRKSFLEKTLPTWAAMKCFEQIIIVDWGMKEDLKSLFIDPRIVMLQVPEVDKYDMGKSMNLGIRHCKSDYVLLIDADVLINEKSIALTKLLFKLMNGDFPAGSFVVQARNYTSLTGTCVYEVEALKKHGGYAEGLPTRGFEEIEFRNRASQKGGTISFDIFPGMFFHIDHDDKIRFENFELKDFDIISADQHNQKAVKSIDFSKQSQPIKCNVVTKKKKKTGVMV